MAPARAFVALILPTFLVACYTRLPPVMGPDGLVYQAIECRHRYDCLAVIGDECGARGYVVQDDFTEGGPAVAAVVSPSIAVAARRHRDTILYRCK